MEIPFSKKSHSHISSSSASFLYHSLALSLLILHTFSLFSNSSLFAQILTLFEGSTELNSAKMCKSRKLNLNLSSQETSCYPLPSSYFIIFNFFASLNSFHSSFTHISWRIQEAIFARKRTQKKSQRLTYENERTFLMDISSDGDTQSESWISFQNGLNHLELTTLPVFAKKYSQCLKIRKICAKMMNNINNLRW